VKENRGTQLTPTDISVTDSDRVPVGILFGDMKGSTEEAERDEKSSVAKLREYERIISETAQRFGPSFYKVKTEGDGFMATFANAHTMVEYGSAVQDEFRARSWQVRLGGHYGEVYRNESGDVFGADVNRAARIQSAADAAQCQFLVSETVKSIVRDRLEHIRFRPHAPIVVKGVGEALVVFEVVPASRRDAEGPPKPARQAATFQTRAPVRGLVSRWVRWALAGAGVLVLAAGMALVLSRTWLPAKHSGRPAALPVSPQGANTIAVMEFENQRGDDLENNWYCKALQTAFNTELSKIPQVSVVAPEIIQRVAKEEGLDRIGAARRLGVTRFVTGSFAVVGNAMRIDARIVQTTNGLQEAAGDVQGSQDDFFSLQQKIALSVLEHFRVRLTRSQATSLTKATSAPVDKYRMLLEAEGVTRRETGAPDAVPGPQSRPQLGPGPMVRYVAEWLAEACVPAVHAEEPRGTAEQVARHILEEYRRAHEHGDIDQLAALYVSFPDSQRRAVLAYSKNIEDLHVELTDIRIQPRDQDILVSYTRHDRFVDKETGEPMSLEVRLTRFLVQEDGQWKFAPGE
jgi:class 3 adenylate cyclase/TolB-like protein